MDDLDGGAGAGDASCLGEGAVGASSPHAQPSASEGGPKSNDPNIEEQDTDQPQVESPMTANESACRHNADGSAHQPHPRPDDSLNDSSGSSIGYGLPPRGSVGSSGSGSGGDAGRDDSHGSNFAAAAAAEDTSHSHRGRDSLSGSVSVGGGSGSGGIDESLLVSPILTDYFAGGAGGEGGKKSRPRTDEKEDNKPGQKREESSSAKNDDMARELDMSDAAAVQEQEEKKVEGDGVQDPDSRGGAQVNLGQQLQLDTSMCPSLGLGSAGSDDVDKEKDDEEEEDDNVDDEPEGGGGSNNGTAPTLLATSSIPESIGIEADGTFETTDEDVKEMQSEKMNDESSLKSDPEVATANQKVEEDASDTCGDPAEPVSEQMDKEPPFEEVAEESLSMESVEPESSSPPVLEVVDTFDNTKKNDTDRGNDDVEDDEQLQLNAHDSNTTFDRESLELSGSIDSQNPSAGADNDASCRPIPEKEVGLLGEKNMAGPVGFDDPLKCSLSPIARHSSTSPVSRRSPVVQEGHNVQDTNQSLDTTATKEEEKKEGVASVDAPMQESPAEPSANQEPSPPGKHPSPSTEASLSPVLEGAIGEGGEHSPSYLAATTNDDSLGVFLSPPEAQPSTTTDDALALAEPSPGNNDLSSAKKKLGASSHALVERLRGAAQKRKQLVTKSRNSFVAREQKQKLSLENIALSSHPEEEEYEEEYAPLASEPTRPVATQKRHFEGVNPVKAFKARPLPATTGDIGSAGQTGVPKVAKRSPTVPSSPLLGHRRQLKEGDTGESKAYQKVKEEERRRREASVSTTTLKKPSPSSLAPSRKPSPREDESFVPFKARPLPATTGTIGQGGQTGVPKVAKRSPTVPSSPLLGFRRPTSSASQPSKAYQAVAKETKMSLTASSTQRPGNESSVSSVKPSALRAQPFDRLLSGSEASRAKEAALREQRERQEAEARRKSNFRARPLPATTAPSPSYSTPSPNLLGLDLMSSEHKRFCQGNAKYPGEENSTPTNEMRASAESPTKKQRTESSSFPDCLHSTIRARKRAEYEEQRLAHDQERQQREAQQRKQIIYQTSQELDELKDRI